MKCPVCDNVNTSMICPKCGFDSSRDYGKYPTLSPARRVPSASALRAQHQQPRIIPEPIPPAPPAVQPPRRKGIGILAVIVCLIALGAGLWFGLGANGTESGNWSDNMLCSDTIEYQSSDPTDWPCEAEEYPVFDSEYQRWEIQSVTFLDTLKNMPNNAWDVSMYGDGSVMAWVKYNGDLYDLYIGANGGINGAEACSDLFAGYSFLEEINFGNAFHTDDAKSMAWMFSGCMSLESLDLSSLDTSNVEDMCCMFESCMMLTDLDLSDFDTRWVQDMSFMFSECYSLRSVNLSSFNTTRVEDMCGMFINCFSLEKLDLRNFRTSNVWDMSYMFCACESLQRLNLSNFDTSNVVDMTDMFTDCPAGEEWSYLLN